MIFPMFAISTYLLDTYKDENKQLNDNAIMQVLINVSALFSCRIHVFIVEEST